MTATAGPSFRRLVAVELRKMTDTRAGTWLLALTAVGAAAAAGVAAAVASADDQSLARFLSVAIQAAGTLLPVVGTLAITSEWSQRTATTTFALVPRRERVVAAKVAAALALALAATAVCLLVSVLAAAVSGASWDLTLAGVGRAALFLALWVLAGFAFGAVLLNTPAAIVAQFLQPVALVALAAAIPGAQATMHWLDLVTPVTRLGRLAEPMSGEDFAQLATGAALWVLVPLVIGFARVRRREVAFA